MHFFGTMGVLSFVAGFLVAVWLIAEKLHSIAEGLPYRNATDQPLFYFGLVAIIVGFQLFLTGFVAELISRSSSDKNQYQIEKVI